MSNIVREIMNDIAYRLGDSGMTDPLPAIIIRQMKRLYEQLNEEYMLVQTNKLFQTGDWTEDSVLGWYAALPADYLEAYQVYNVTNDRYPDFQNEMQYKKDQSNTFTIDNHIIYFSSLQGTEDIKIFYYSMGKILVDKTDAAVLPSAATEVNTPEWRKDFYQYLMCGSAVRLKVDYPLYATDLRDFEAGKVKMSKYRYHKTNVTPTITGGARVRPVRKWYGDG